MYNKWYDKKNEVEMRLKRKYIIITTHKYMRKGTIH